jgi:hypothetical protein
MVNSGSLSKLHVHISLDRALQRQTPNNKWSKEKPSNNHECYLYVLFTHEFSENKSDFCEYRFSTLYAGGLKMRTCTPLDYF